MSDITNNRKIEHLQTIQKDPKTDRCGNYFEQIQLTHRALPELSLQDISTECEFLGYQLSFPMLISSMTGGDHQLIKTINHNLAQAAEITGVAMAVGSQRVIQNNAEAAASFRLRELAPNVPLIGNLGAVQLNHGGDQQLVQAAIDLLQADALYLHLNPLQEAIQPEGDIDFSNLQAKIADLVNKIEVPILLKEVGCGLSPQDIELGLSAGIKFFDVAGSGGTSWSRIEHHRRHHNDDLGLLFQDWGIPTPLAIKLAAPYMNQAKIIASGGIRNGIDMVKSVIMGVSLCGMAGPLLQPAMNSVQDVVEKIETIKQQFKTAMFLLGMPDIATLHNNKALILQTNWN